MLSKTKKVLYTNPLTINLMRKYLISRMKKIPLEIAIETTSICNIDCAMCPHKTIKREQKPMEEKLFRKIVDEIEKIGIKYIFLQHFGEPLTLSDEIFNFELSYIRQKVSKAYLNLATNAKSLTEEKIKIILNNKVDNITINFSAVTKETYEKIYRGAVYEKVEENILNLIEHKKKLGVSYPNIVMDMIRMQETVNEIEEYKRKWASIVDSVHIANYSARGGTLDWEKADSVLPVFSTPRPCYRIYKQLAICSDGKVPLCCSDWNCEVVLGDINSQKILEVWQGEVLRKIRESDFRGERDKTPICVNCFPERWDFFPPWWYK